MSDYESLQKLAYGLIVIMLIFNFLGSTVVYEEEIDMVEDPADVMFYLDEIELKAGGDKLSYSYSEFGFSEMEEVMTNLGYLTLLTLLASAFFAWKIKEVIEGSDDLEIIQKAGYAVSILAILSALYPVYAIPNALEDDWKSGPFDEGDGFDYDGGFMGDQKIDDPDWGEVEIDSGPGTGWYLLVLGGILGFVIYTRVNNLD
mgnify:CR=1 FL=1